jgi:hypothetical protein
VWVVLVQTIFRLRPALMEMASRVTITPTKGADVALKVDIAARIRRNDMITTQADLKAGDHAQAGYNPATMLAIRLDVETGEED